MKKAIYIVTKITSSAEGTEKLNGRNRDLSLTKKEGDDEMPDQLTLTDASDEELDFVHTGLSLNVLIKDMSMVTEDGKIAFLECETGVMEAEVEKDESKDENVTDQSNQPNS